jgi:hypothetical protein
MIHEDHPHLTALPRYFDEIVLVFRTIIISLILKDGYL